MLGTSLSLLAGAVVAATPVTPLPWFDFDDYPMKSFEKQHEGVTGFELLVTPDGSIGDCRVTISSGYQELDRTTCDLVLKRVKFRPARDAGGQAVWGTYRSQAIWVLPERTIDAAPPPDLEISVNKLPEGAKEPPAVKLAFAVDASGNPSECTLMPTSLPQPAVMVELGCKALLESEKGKPVIAPSGQPVAAVKTGAVLFKAGS